MINEYYVKAPSTYFYETPDKVSAVTDQLLYGTSLVSIEDSVVKSQENEFLYCETSYGYRGFVKSDCIERRTGKNTLEEYIVVSNFCDVLEVPEYKYKPVMTLPKGSIVHRKPDSFELSCGFCDVVIGTKVYYVRSEQIKSTQEAYKRCDEITQRRMIVDNALSYVGTPYRWGGKTPSGIDCSGLCFMAFALCGIRIYRDAVPDAQYVKTVGFDKLKQADLVYYKGHVVMYIGDKEYVHSSATLGGVTVSSFDENSPVYYKKLSEGILCCARSVEF